MIVQSIQFENFRNIEKASLVFEPGLNVLVGENAQGKTNALEGIYLFAQGRSFRTSKEKEFIGPCQEYAYAKLCFRDQTSHKNSEMRFLKNGKKVVRREGIPERKMSAFLGAFRAVLFCPEHLSIVKAGPAERRRFLNEAMAQISSGAIGALQRYNSILAQRNKLIASYYENKKTVQDTISFWNEQLAEEAAYLSGKREAYVTELSRYAKEIFHDMTNGQEEPAFHYNGARNKEEFIKLWEESFEKDVRIGTTTRGIHKDDVLVLLNGKEARAYASQGQQRSLALAMKLAEAEISRTKTGENPVMLFDDILSELDEKRKQYVLAGIKDRQVILTTCEEKVLAEVTTKKLTNKPTDRQACRATRNGQEKENVMIINVKNGRYEPCMYT
ncbi:MAG: DNA replication/repair protein RecF [Clostridiales bacterium]|nr:DNA replication/repair protein RecF [Clostridiales bacterium]